MANVSGGHEDVGPPLFFAKAPVHHSV